MDLDKLRYVILSGKFPKTSIDQETHNKAYAFWKQFWNDVFKENKTSDTVCADNFWRQDIVSMIMYEDNVVGMHLYSFFDLRSLTAREHTYLSNSFNDIYIEKLKRHDAKSLMSIEYLSVAPGCRKKDIGISLSTVLLALACKYQDHFNIDALVAPSRSDNKVTQSILELGGEVLVGNLQMHNTPIDLIAFFRGKSHAHPNAQIDGLVQRLWNSKIDRIGIFKEDSVDKIAA